MALRAAHSLGWGLVSDGGADLRRGRPKFLTAMGEDGTVEFWRSIPGDGALLTGCEGAAAGC